MKKLVGIILAVTLLCQGDEFLDDAMERYDFASWAGTTNMLYTTIAQPVDILSINLPTNGISTTTKYIDDTERHEKQLMVFSPSDKTFLLRIRTGHGATVLDAQNELIRTLSDSATVRLFSVTNGLAGDRCYCKFVPNRFGYVTFARNNIFVEVLAHTTNSISVADIAVQLDAAILNASTNAPGR
jgi:hypothetical protein